MAKTIYTIDLSDQGNPPFGGCCVSLPKGTTLRFVLKVGSKLCTRSPVLLTNFPIDEKSLFDRKRFHQIESPVFTGVSDWTATITLTRAGAYDYYLIWKEIEDDVSDEQRGEVGHFVVEPELRVKSKTMLISEICMQTVLTRCLGPLSRWEEHFDTASRLGFNAIHFTPIQELGVSGSNYSLYDQLQLNSMLFPDETIFDGLKAAEKDALKEERLEAVLEKMENEYGIAGIVDVVWNHTAINSPWLGDHPEATYNILNCPYLTPAFIIDQALAKLSKDLIDGVYRNTHGVGAEITCEDHISKIVNIFRYEVVPKLKLWEFMVINVDNAVESFQEAIRNSQPRDEPTVVYHGNELDQLKKEGLYRDKSWDRHSVRVNMKWALKLYGPIRIRGALDPSRTKESIGEFKKALDIINLPIYHRLDDDINSICRNITERIRYERLASHGPQKGNLSEASPLVEPYFTAIKKSDKIVTWAANNGWVWGGNPLENFADPPARAYFRRDVIIWADSVKLRYGKGPEDSPWLWTRMREYTQRMAKIFQGIRIDNCHSTPIEVARYLVDAAREVRPDLYIMAELFTGNEKYDNIFIAKLGINSLIREAMSAHDPCEMGRLVHRYGGTPIGSLIQYYPPSYSDDRSSSSDIILSVKPVTPPALFFDCTHDNEVPAQKRTVQDTLSNAVLTWSAACPVGTTLGYDILVPRRVEVNDPRLYAVVPENVYPGMTLARKTLNELHQRLASQGFTEIHVHQDGDLLIIQRHSPRTHRAAFFIVHTAFWQGNTNPTPARAIIPARITNYLLCGRLLLDPKSHPEDKGTITGLNGELVVSREHDRVFSVQTIVQDGGATAQEITWKDFPPGSVLILETTLPGEGESAVKELLSLDSDTKLHLLFRDLDPVDFNYLLYRCENEERASTEGKRGVYSVPRYGQLVYAGLQGWVSLLNKIRSANDMGHPLFDNLRQGNWQMDFIVERLRDCSALDGIRDWVVKYFTLVKKLPRHLIPKYFDKVIMKLYLSARHYVIRYLSSEFVWKSTDPLVSELAVTGLQFIAKLRDTALISPLVARYDKPLDITMAAGLPHFTTGYMRAWGRDTFIALPGLLLTTGRFEEARSLLIGFASCLRHGLIPNLLDSGRNPRYNCRDAAWWFLQALQEYCGASKEGLSFLSKPEVVRLFPQDDSPTNNPQPLTEKVPMYEIVQEIMQRHASGIEFRERNAGHHIDAHMRDRGFNIKIFLDRNTGMIHGGNEWNCGTWMDKMGESDNAHNRGVPASPRDGAAIEIIGLLKSALRWLSKISADPKVFPYAGVSIKTSTDAAAVFSYSGWDALVQKNFEKCFYVPSDPKKDANYFVDKSIIHRRGMYKDTHGSHHRWTDYQLRPNYCVAMAVAPELFDREHALKAIEMFEKILLGPLGARTLDPQDKQYRPNYESGNWSDDYLTSKGFNYHLGPEWLWPVGYYVSAKLIFAPANCDRVKMTNKLQQLLRRYREYLVNSDWKGLPELTNHNGAVCPSSCTTQAWSAATILHALQRLYSQ